MTDNQEVARARLGGQPWRLPLRDWKLLARRTWSEQGDDNVGLMAAGVAFYGFVALVPLLGAIVLTYGFFADQETVIDNVRHLMTVMPASAAEVAGEQLMQVVQTSGGKKGLGLAIALVIALFGARSGAGALITALNIAYEETETRSFLRVSLLALVVTAAGVLFSILAAATIALIDYLEDLLPFASGFCAVLGNGVTYLLLAAACAAGSATLYRYGPARRHVSWEWLTPGSLLTTGGWLLLTLLFGLYVSDLGRFNATYGSLSAVIALLTWLYISSYIFLLGAELNSELEKLLEQRAAVEGGGGPSPPSSPTGRAAAKHGEADHKSA